MTDINQGRAEAQQRPAPAPTPTPKRGLLRRLRQRTGRWMTIAAVTVDLLMLNAVIDSTASIRTDWVFRLPPLVILAALFCPLYHLAAFRMRWRSRRAEVDEQRQAWTGMGWGR